MTVVQGGCDERAGDASFPQEQKILDPAYPPGGPHPTLRPGSLPYLVEASEIRPAAGADPFERHHDHVLRPEIGALPQPHRIECLGTTPIQREQKAICCERARPFEQLDVALALAAEHRPYTGDRQQLLEPVRGSDPGIDP